MVVPLATARGESSISMRFGKVTCCAGLTTPHYDVKTLCLGVRLHHQRITDNLSIGSESRASTYPPKSGQSRCLVRSCRDWVSAIWVECGVDYVTRRCLESEITNPQPYQLILLGRNGVNV
jgi:hypothetical protein